MDACLLEDAFFVDDLEELAGEFFGESEREEEAGARLGYFLPTFDVEDGKVVFAFELSDAAADCHASGDGFNDFVVDGVYLSAEGVEDFGFGL